MKSEDTTVNHPRPTYTNTPSQIMTCAVNQVIECPVLKHSTKPTTDGVGEASSQAKSQTKQEDLLETKRD